jgi:hypothetical protein
MTKKYKPHSEVFKGSCGHSYPDLTFLAFVELKENFHAIWYRCGKCKKRYMEELNINELPEPMQQELLKKKIVDNRQYLDFIFDFIRAFPV